MHVAALTEPTLAEMIQGLPLSIVFAEGEAIEALRARGEGSLLLQPPFHVSDSDAYLVLPDDIGLELVDMFRDGDLDLLAEAMRDGLIVVGTIEKEGRGRIVLSVEQSARPADLLQELPFGETIGVGRGVDPLPLLNALEQVQCTVASGFVDDQGLEKMLRKREYAGVSWRVPKADKHLAHVDPTYVWSKRQPDGRVGIECALFSEYEELVAVLRPAVLAPADRLQVAPPPA
ncbi:MAG: hypothetical protein M3Y87_11175 [Myxococcota bacterium]|nr:hypothetical protein [Myxococcota bacterium]